MKKAHSLRSLLLLSAASMLISACVNDQNLAADTHQSGQQLYRALCASCHGLTGKGDGPVAPQLVTRPADLTQIAQRRNGKFDAEAIHQIIDGRWDKTVHGTREMPVWGMRLYFRLDSDDAIVREQDEARIAREQTDERIAWLVEYLRSIQQR